MKTLIITYFLLDNTWYVNCIGTGSTNLCFGVD
jgi:hypothetical protein